jgi:hypothetical protein
MISSVSVKKIFNLVKSFHFYGGLKCPRQQKFLLAILNLGMISSVLVKKIFNSVKSFHFYGGLKFAKMPFLMDLVRRQKSLERAIFVKRPQGTRQNKAFVPYSNL